MTANLIVKFIVFLSIIPGLIQLCMKSLKNYLWLQGKLDQEVIEMPVDEICVENAIIS